jgi:murein L,D-transpeptidase YcbB/YkuD
LLRLPIDFRLLLLLGLLAVTPARAQAPAVAPATVISPFLAGTNPAIGTETVQLGLLNAVYGPRQSTPLWLDAQGQPTAAARTALGLLEKADTEGLHPAAYHVPALDTFTVFTTPQEQAGFELLLSDGLALYMHDLRIGRTPIGKLPRTPKPSMQRRPC